MFKANNFIFRRTALAEALVAAGYAKDTPFVRDAKALATLRQKEDKNNSLPSKEIVLNIPDAVAA